jgi:ParB-like chromosome segregation protein Spo0J
MAVKIVEAEPLAGAESPRIEQRQVADLIPFINNPRTHSQDQISIIAASIRQFGWTNPVLIDARSGIIAGHGRVLAARKLGLTQVPCIELSHLSDAQRRAYVIADNQTALRAGWDEDLLRLELGELQALEFDLGVLGFEAGALDALLAPAADGGIGAVPGDAYKEQYGVIVVCTSEAHQAEAYERLKADGFTCRVVTT